MKRLLLLFFVTSWIFGLNAQTNVLQTKDSTFIYNTDEIELLKVNSELDPMRSALLSAMLPGLGQVYNKQYWKVPIVVSGIVVFGHFIDYNNKVYHSLRNAVKLYDISPDNNTYGDLISNRETLVRNRDNFRRNRDFLMILGTGFYLLQIVDAHVAAHLDEFNLNDDLALGIEPSIQSTPLFSHAVGVSLVLRF
ncbi:MAG: DUF5683 domain-containing protein [Ekhidna sp.]